MVKVSIITACYNSQHSIEEALKSIQHQDYQNIEHIVIDGASKDTTLSIIDKYKDRIARIISEQDNGIYDALNKGISLATGDIIGILHSDDFYTHNSVISKIVKQFENTNAEAVYSDLQYVDKENTAKVTRYWKSGDYKEGMFLRGWMPPHPTFFAKKSLYQQYGMFNTKLKSAADYELMLRFIHKNKIRVVYIPEVLIKMRVGGKSNATLMNRIKANQEDRMAWKINNLTPRLYTLILKPFSKLAQFIKY